MRLRFPRGPGGAQIPLSPITPEQACRGWLAMLVHVPSDAERWRRLAELTRELAETTREPDAKITLLTIVSHYERLAIRAEIFEKFGAA